MRCMFCELEVLNQDDSLGRPISLAQRGVAHSNCEELAATQHQRGVSTSSFGRSSSQKTP